MAENERSIALPSGGIVYAVAVINHHDATILRRHHLRLGRFMGPTRDSEGGRTSEYRADLTPTELDAKDELILATEGLYIRTLVRCWSGVTAGGEPLAFPDDVDRMDERDYQYLAGDLLTSRADPNAPGPPSASLSPVESSPTIPTSEKT